MLTSCCVIELLKSRFDVLFLFSREPSRLQNQKWTSQETSIKKYDAKTPPQPVIDDATSSGSPRVIDRGSAKSKSSLRSSALQNFGKSNIHVKAHNHIGECTLKLEKTIRQTKLIQCFEHLHSFRLCGRLFSNCFNIDNSAVASASIETESYLGGLPSDLCIIRACPSRTQRDSLPLCDRCELQVTA